MLVWDILPVTYHFIFSRVKAEGGGLIIWEEFGSPSAVLSFADANTTLLWGGISSSSARLWFLSGNPNNHDNRRTARKSIKLYNVTVVGCSSSIYFPSISFPSHLFCILFFRFHQLLGICFLFQLFCYSTHRSSPSTPIHTSTQDTPPCWSVMLWSRPPPSFPRGFVSVLQNVTFFLSISRFIITWLVATAPLFLIGCSISFSSHLCFCI